jgi:hypothetical protein
MPVFGHMEASHTTSNVLGFESFSAFQTAPVGLSESSFWTTLSLAQSGLNMQ